VGLNKNVHFNNDKDAEMSWGRSKRVAAVIGVLLAFTMGAVGWAQQEAPSAPSQQERQSGSGMMGAGMMGGMMGPGTMGGMMPMMGDVSQMMPACTQMMNQMMSQAPGPSQPKSPAPAPKSETK
jgi:uncharacterized membrane protein YfcA